MTRCIISLIICLNLAFQTPAWCSIHLSLKETNPYHIEIISQVFDALLDEQVHRPGSELDRSFVVEDAGLHYLRLRSKKAVFLKQLKLLQEGIPSR